MSESYQGPGVYRHYKGGLYQVHGLAVSEELADGERMDRGALLDDTLRVVYQPLSPGSVLEQFPQVAFWSRTLADFNQLVEREHGQVRRFAKEPVL